MSLPHECARSNADSISQFLEETDHVRRELIFPMVIELQQPDDLVVRPQGNERNRFVTRAIAPITGVSLTVLFRRRG